MAAARAVKETRLLCRPVVQSHSRRRPAPRAVEAAPLHVVQIRDMEYNPLPPMTPIGWFHAVSIRAARRRWMTDGRRHKMAPAPGGIVQQARALGSETTMAAEIRDFESDVMEAFAALFY